MRARAAFLLLPLLLPGCILFGSPCTEFPPRAEATLDANTTRAQIEEALLAEGWTLRSEEPGAVVVADLTRNGTSYTAYGFPPGHGPSSTARLEIHGGPVEAASEPAARKHLAPLAQPLFARLDAEPQYVGGNRHCGAV